MPLDTLVRARAGEHTAPADGKVRLHLGCGNDILAGWVNLDHAPAPGIDVVADLGSCRIRPLPFADETVDEILACHVLEHIADILPLMAELWRIAKPGAVLTAHVPYGSSDDAWEDPTHVRAYFLQSWGYYSQPYYWRSSGYGYHGDWQPERVDLLIEEHRIGDPQTVVARIDTERNMVREMVATLIKVSPPRPASKELLRLPRVEAKPLKREDA